MLTAVATLTVGSFTPNIRMRSQYACSCGLLPCRWPSSAIFTCFGVLSFRHQGILPGLRISSLAA